MNRYHHTRMLTLSGIIIALYIVTMYITQSFAFGPIQIRLATSIYSLAYLFPFLIVPLGLANILSNLLFGGLGPLDLLGGGVVGVLTTSLVFLVRKYQLNIRWIILPIIFIPGLGVPLWLSPLTGIPYQLLAVQLILGQIIPAFLGLYLVNVLQKRI